MTNINLSAIEEKYFIEQFRDYFESKMGIQITIQSPIMSVKYNQLDRGQSLPDGIIEGLGVWMELTTFSRNQAMRKQIGELRKFPDRYSKHAYIPGVAINLDKNMLVSQAYEAISKKITKDYSQFVTLSKTQDKGILLIRFVNNDPFHDDNEFRELFDLLSDEHILYSWRVHQGQFNMIMLSSFINSQSYPRLRFAVIADDETFSRLRSRDQIKQEKMSNLFSEKPKKE